MSAPPCSKCKGEVAAVHEEGILTHWWCWTCDNETPADTHPCSCVNCVGPAIRMETLKIIAARWSLKKLKGRCTVTESGCWEWNGRIGGSGYGRHETTVQGRRKHIVVHRLAFVLAFGLPSKPYVCHRCDNRICANPEHLFEGTHRDNMDDMMAKGRTNNGNRDKDACPRCGGLYSESKHKSQATKNGRGRRRCLPCKRKKQAEYMVGWRQRLREGVG